MSAIAPGAEPEPRKGGSSRVWKREQLPRSPPWDAAISLLVILHQEPGEARPLHKGLAVVEAVQLEED